MIAAEHIDCPRTLGINMGLFMEKVSPEPTSGCWLWTGAVNPGGYGKVGYLRKDRSSAMFVAHRVSYEHFVGPIPEGKQLDHYFCNTPSCVNPKHVRPVTAHENILRSEGQGSKNLAKTHCKRGHALTHENIYRNPNQNNRACRTCKKMYKEN